MIGYISEDGEKYIGEDDFDSSYVDSEQSKDGFTVRHEVERLNCRIRRQPIGFKYGKKARRYNQEESGKAAIRT